MCVSKESGDYGGLGDDVVVVFDARYETAGVDFKVPWFARCVEVDDYFVIGETEFFNYDVGAVGPGAAVIGVEGDFGGGAVGGHGCLLAFSAYSWGRELWPGGDVG